MRGLVRLDSSMNIEKKEHEMSSLTGKVALVTGASKGIGAGIAKALAAAGANVVVNYSSSPQGAEKVVDEICGLGAGKAVAIKGDVSKSEEVKQLLEETKNAFGSLDILVNNAGVFAMHPLSEVTEEEFHRQFNINVLGPIQTTREALKYFSPSGASVINISSVVSTKAIPNSVVYSATKGALDSITEVLAAELGPRGIRVNSINPDFTRTEGTETAGIYGSDFETNAVAETPLGRPGKPKDIGEVAVFLASNESAWITGENIRVSGGLK